MEKKTVEGEEGGASRRERERRESTRGGGE